MHTWQRTGPALSSTCPSKNVGLHPSVCRALQGEFDTSPPVHGSAASLGRKLGATAVVEWWNASHQLDRPQSIARGCLHHQNVSHRCTHAEWRREGLRGLMSQLPAEELSIAGHAAALAAWHSMHAFCGRCLPLSSPVPPHTPSPAPACPYHRPPPLPSQGDEPGNNRRPLSITFRCMFPSAGGTLVRRKIVLRVVLPTFVLQGKLAGHDTASLPAYRRCGCPTVSVEAGAKRQCTGEGRHRVYPRTDPVVRIWPGTLGFLATARLFPKTHGDVALRKAGRAHKHPRERPREENQVDSSARLQATTRAMCCAV